MIHGMPFTVYNLFVGLIAGAGLCYLLYLKHVVIGYRRFVTFLMGGLLVFSVAGPVTELIAPEWVHLVHGFAALLVVFSLYDPVHNDLRKDEWVKLMFDNPSQIRDARQWMRPMDERILELFHSFDLVLTPSIIAYNLDYSSKEVNRRLSELKNHGFVERVDRGKYRLTEIGELYLEGRLLEAENSESVAVHTDG